MNKQFSPRTISGLNDDRTQFTISNSRIDNINIKSMKKLTKNNNHNSEKIVHYAALQEKYNSISVFENYKERDNIESIVNPADISKSERRKSKAVRMKKTIDAIHSAASNNSRNKNIKSLGKITKLSVKDNPSDELNSEPNLIKKEAIKVVHSERQKNVFNCEKNAQNSTSILQKNNVTSNKNEKKRVNKKISNLLNMPNLNRLCLKSLQSSHQKTKTIEIISNSTLKEDKDQSSKLAKNESKKYRTFAENCFSSYPPHISPKSCFNNTITAAFTKPKQKQDEKTAIESKIPEFSAKLLKKTLSSEKQMQSNENIVEKSTKSIKTIDKIGTDNIMSARRKKTETHEKLTFFTKKNVAKDEVRRGSPYNSRSKSGKSINSKSSDKLKYPFYIKNLNLINNKLVSKEKCYINVDNLKEMVQNNTVPQKNHKSLNTVKSANNLTNSNLMTTATQISNNLVTPKSNSGFSNFQKATLSNNKKTSHFNAKNTSISKIIEKDNLSKSNRDQKVTHDKKTIKQMMLNLKDCNTFNDFRDKKIKEQNETRKATEISQNLENRIERTSSIVTIQSPVKTVLKGQTSFKNREKFDREKIKLSARLGRENVIYKKENEDTKYSAREIRDKHINIELNKTQTIKKDFDRFDVKQPKKLTQQIRAETLPTNFSDLNSINLNNTDSEIPQEELLNDDDIKNIDINIMDGDSFLMCDDEVIENMSTKKDQERPNPFCEENELHSFVQENLPREATTEHSIMANETLSIGEHQIQQEDQQEESDPNKDDESKVCWQTLDNMLKDEEIYQIDKNFMENDQKEVKMKMRAILIDWISEVCSDYLFTRDTFYTAVKYVDLYQTKQSNILKNNFQLVGICAVFMSMKIQEVIIIPSAEFLRLANDIYDTKQQREIEQNLINRLDWKLNPITLNHWQSYISHKWDEFTTNQNIEKILVVPDGVDFNYRKRNIKSYINYREISQYMDACLMVPEHLNYNGGLQIASFIYLHIAIKLEIFLLSDVHQYFHSSSLYIVDENLIYNWVFGNFQTEYLKVGLDELLPFAQFASIFFSLPMEVQTPNQQNFEDYIDRSYEEMLSYMIYNPNCLQFICDRNF